MNTKSKYSALYVTNAAVIAALYVVLTWLSGVFGLAGNNAIQFRLSEVLTILPYFTPAAIPGLTLGCLLANILVLGAVPWDIAFGTLATLLAALGTYAFRKYKWLAPVFPIVANTLIVPPVLIYAYGLSDAWWYLALTVFIGEFVMCGVGGMLLLFAIEKRGILFPKLSKKPAAVPEKAESPSENE